MAYTRGRGSRRLLVGAGVGCALAAALGRPALGVTISRGTCCRPSSRPIRRAFPFVALLVSGGHTQLLRVHDVGRYVLLGDTIDDAAGEAFDKSAKLLGLGYPGGPALAGWPSSATRSLRAAAALLHRDTLDFSFAGLKTAVRTTPCRLDGADSSRPAPTSPHRRRRRIVDVLVRASIARARRHRARRASSSPAGWARTRSLRSGSMAPARPRAARVH